MTSKIEVLKSITNTLNFKALQVFEINGVCDNQGVYIERFPQTYNFDTKSAYYVSLLNFQCSAFFQTSQNQIINFTIQLQDKYMS